ncbi:MAG TPA: hypothetical protein DEB46_14245 [Myxococcales bacterium]|nr:hypothetical protein [Myxococcales bacterium]
MFFSGLPSEIRHKGIASLSLVKLEFESVRPRKGNPVAWIIIAKLVGVVKTPASQSTQPRAVKFISKRMALRMFTRCALTHSAVLSEAQGPLVFNGLSR